MSEQYSKTCVLIWKLGTDEPTEVRKYKVLILNYKSVLGYSSDSSR